VAFLFQSDGADYFIRVNIQGFYNLREIKYRYISLTSFNLSVIRATKAYNISKLFL